MAGRPGAAYGDRKPGDPAAAGDSPGTAQQYAARHVAAFNRAVETEDFRNFLARFTDDAVIRFENVPGVGVLAFVGRAAYTAAYEDQPPDDQIDIVGSVRREKDVIVIPFTWRRDGGPGIMRAIVSAGLIAGMSVQFG